MSTYANGKYAYGICDITGFRYRLRDMKMTWDGFLVGPDQWSPKHPQLSPRPDNADDNNFFTVYTNTGLGKLGSQLTTFEVDCEVGSVTITTT